MQKIKYILPPLLCLAFLFSCFREEPVGTGTGTGTGTGGGEPVSVTFRVNVPGQKVVGSRAVGETDERRLESIDALVFTQWGNFLYRAQTSDPTPDGQLVNFTVDFYSSADPRTVHFIANCRAQAEAFDFDSYAGRSEEEVLKQFESAIASTPELGAQTAFPFPMWGSKAFPDIPSTGIPSAEDRTFKLLRSVARVDVGLNNASPGSVTASWQGLPNFTLTSVELCNAPDKGRVVPFADNYDASGGTVTAPSIVPGSGSVNYAGAAGGPQAIERALYLYERTAGADQTDAPYLIIGGSFDGEAATYYKVLLRDAAGNLIPILRNHLYRVNITAVGGRGHASADIARANNAGGIMSHIEVVDTGLQTSVYDENHHLSADRVELKFFREGTSVDLTLETNYGGKAGETEKITIVGKPDWLTLTDKNSGADYTTGIPAGSGSIRMSVTADGITDDSDREAAITFMIGRLELQIDISQSKYPELDLTVDPELIVFYKNGKPQIGTPKFDDDNTAPHYGDARVTVGTFSHTPAAETLAFEFTPKTGIVWAASDFARFPDPSTPVAEAAAGAGGEFNLLAGQLAGGSNLEGELKVKLSVPYGGGRTHTVEKIITVRQITQDAVLLAKAYNPYSPAGGRFPIQVISETVWSSSLVEGSSDMMTSLPACPDPFTEVSAPLIELTENNTFESRTATVEVATATNQTLVNIEQEGYKLVFDVPQTLYTVKGATPADVQIPFTVNTEWKYALGGNDFADAGTIAPYIEDTNYEPSGVAPNAPQTVTDFIYRPKAYPAAEGTPLAQVITRQLTFTNVDVGGNDRIVTILRYVPSHFSATVTASDDGALPTAFPRAGADIKVKAATNASWYASWKAGTTGVETNFGVAPTATYTTQEAALTVGVNNSWSERSIIVTATYYDVENNGFVTIGELVNKNQPGYSISQATVTADNINENGGSATVKIEGDYPAITLAVRVKSGSTHNASNLATATVSAGTANSATISVPANMGNAVRTITVGYIHPYTGVFAPVKSYAQGLAPYDMGTFWWSRNDLGPTQYNPSTCPSGWSVPTITQGNTIMTALNSNGGTFYNADTKDFWLSEKPDNAAPGIYNYYLRWLGLSATWMRSIDGNGFHYTRCVKAK